MREALAELGVDATVEHVTDTADIASYSSSPGTQPGLRGSRVEYPWEPTTLV